MRYILGFYGGYLALTILSLILSALLWALNWKKSFSVQLFSLIILLQSIVLVLGQIINIIDYTAIYNYCYFQALAVNVLFTAMYGAALCVYFDWYQIISSTKLLDKNSTRSRLQRLAYIIVVFILPFVVIMATWGSSNFLIAGYGAFFCDTNSSSVVTAGIFLRAFYVLAGLILLYLTLSQFWSKVMVAFKAFGRTKSSESSYSTNSQTNSKYQSNTDDLSGSAASKALSNSENAKPSILKRAVSSLNGTRTFLNSSQQPSKRELGASLGTNSFDMSATEITRTSSSDPAKIPAKAVVRKASTYQTALLARLGLFCFSYTCIAVPVILWEGITRGYVIHDLFSSQIVDVSDTRANEIYWYSLNSTTVTFQNPYTGANISTQAYMLTGMTTLGVVSSTAATVTIVGLFCAACGLFLVFGTGKPVKARYMELFGIIIRPMNRLLLLISNKTKEEQQPQQQTTIPQQKQKTGLDDSNASQIKKTTSILSSSLNSSQARPTSPLKSRVRTVFDEIDELEAEETATNPRTNEISEIDSSSPAAVTEPAENNALNGLNLIVNSAQVQPTSEVASLAHVDSENPESTDITLRPTT